MAQVPPPIPSRLIPPHPKRTYRALYEEPVNIPFSLDEETQERCYVATYKTFRDTQAPLSVDELLRNMVAFFS
jgi:hypothetical protein